jgi:hypothetical protein
MPRPSTLIPVLLALALLCIGVPTAGASRGQTTYFEAPALLQNPATRPATIAKLEHLGVTALRVELSWRTVAPRPASTHRPSFDATDPASYNWALYDPIVDEAHRLGWKVLLTVTSPVPRWATGNPRKNSPALRPNARMFQQFMTAVGRHYAERVALFSIWNEPNHHEFLEPQFNPNGSPASPGIYRALYSAGYSGLRAAGIAHPQVLIGETAPEGETTPLRRSRSNLAPLKFLRGVLCLSASYHRAGHCARLQASGWGVHPYANGRSPHYVPRNRETVTIGSLGRITRALDAGARAGTLPGHLPIYITEYGVMSKPNPYQGVPVGQQAEYDAQAEQIAYYNARVASFSQYLLRDDPIRRRNVGFQTGLEYVNGRPKPLLAGFALPLTVLHRGSRYLLWGLVRPAHEATELTVEVRPHGSRKFRVLGPARTDSRGYWGLVSTVSGEQWRVRWTSPGGTRYTGAPIRAY